MREFVSRIASFERIPTHNTINAPATIVLGIAPTDLTAGVAVLIGIAAIPSFYAPFIALVASVAVVFGARQVRRTLPPRYFVHLLWSLGLVDTHTRGARGIDRAVRMVFSPSPYLNPFAAKRRRFVSFTP